MAMEVATMADYASTWLIKLDPHYTMDCPFNQSIPCNFSTQVARRAAVWSVGLRPGPPTALLAQQDEWKMATEAAEMDRNMGFNSFNHEKSWDFTMNIDLTMKNPGISP